MQLKSYQAEIEKLEDLGYLPPLRSFLRACWYSLPIFHPYAMVRLCWDLFILIALIYTAVEIPLTLAFEVHLSLNNALGIIAFCVDVVLLLDVAINFRTRYYDKWDGLLLHTNPFDIAKKYFKTWFWLDFMTSLPLEFIVSPDTNKNSQFAIYLKFLRIFRLFRILKILRVIRVMKMFDGLTKMMDIAREMFFVLKVCKIMGAMVLTAHFFACIWWTVGMNAVRTNDSWIQAQGIDPVEDTLFVKYSAAWYWAIVTLFTTGYGDITAHNTTEQWVCSVCILTGSCAYAYFIGTLTSWVAEGDRVRCFEIQKLEEAQAFCRHHKFSRSLTRMVLTHVRYYCNYNFVLDSDDILPLLPPFLQRKIHHKIAKRYLCKMELFRGLPTQVVGDIALTMHSVSCNANQYLFNRGDVALCMYIQRTGEAKLRYNDETPSRPLSRGDVVGERALIAGKRRYDCKVLLWSEFFVLEIESIRCVFRKNFKPKRFKHEWRVLQRKIKMDERRRTKPMRRCRLMQQHSKSPHVSQKDEIINDLSQRGTTMRSEMMERFLFTTPTESATSNRYQPVAMNDEDGGNATVETNKHQTTSGAADSEDSIIRGTEPPELRRIDGVNSQSILAMHPFSVRRNSEMRNMKVISDSATTAFYQNTHTLQRKTSRNKVIEFGDMVSDPLDIDDSTDSDFLLGALHCITPNGKKGSGLNPNVRNKTKMGKFGAPRKRAMRKSKLKKYGVSSSMKRVGVRGGINENDEYCEEAKETRLIISNVESKKSKMDESDKKANAKEISDISHIT